MDLKMKSMAKPILAGILTGALCLSFQNCSEVNFETSPSLLDRLVCDDSGNCLLKGSAILTAGVNLPPLKMFVVVDNSYTMKANQFNLASNFDEMFAANNSANLTPFDTTAYLINTAQHTYPYGSANLLSLNSTLLPLSSLQTLLPADFVSQNRPISTGGLLSGKVPGDVVGYRILNENDRWTFLPAPVVGYASGSAILSEGIRKPANQDSSTFRTEFQDRLRIFNPDYNPDNGSGRFFPETQDNESAMCATARILRNQSAYLKTGDQGQAVDQSVFLMITDENEADLAGRNCIQSVFKTTDSVVDAYCEERHTTYLLSSPNCVGKYTTGYAVDYRYTGSVTLSITYKPAVATYKQSQVSFDENGYNANIYKVDYKRRVYQSQTTSVTYCLAEIRDGVPVDQCSGTFQTKVANGNYASSQTVCNSLASQLSGGKAITSAQSLPVCTFNPAWVSFSKGQSCDTSLSTCQIVYPFAGSLTYTGFIADQDAANLVARNYFASRGWSDPYDGYADNAVPASAAAYTKTGATRALGTCPTGTVALGCTPNQVRKGPYPRKGNLTDNSPAGECANAARAINANADINSNLVCTLDPVDKVDPATTSCSGFVAGECTLTYPNFVTDTTKFSCSASYNSCTENLGSGNISRTLNVPFVAGQYLGPALSVGNTCNAGIKSAVQAVQPLYNPSTDPCTIKTVNTSSQSIAPSAPQTCVEAANALCDTADNSGVKRFCAANETPRTAQTPVAIKEELNCNSKCSDSKLNYCQGQPGASPTTLISDVIATAAGLPPGYSCTATVTKNPLAPKITLLATEVARACPVIGGNGIPNYPDAGRTTAPYQTNLPIVDHVAGSVRNPDGSFSPAKPINQYIKDRSAELFGEGFRPIVSVFVRQTADGSGVGGSVGTDYINLATQMAGQNTSVISGDYGGPLRELSAIIKDRVQHSFVINQMSATQVVHRAWMWNKTTNNWDELQPSDFTAFGKTVVISPSINFDQGDRFRFEYW